RSLGAEPATRRGPSHGCGCGRRRWGPDVPDRTDPADDAGIDCRIRAPADGGPSAHGGAEVPDAPLDHARRDHHLGALLLGSPAPDQLHVPCLVLVEMLVVLQQPPPSPAILT